MHKPSPAAECIRAVMKEKGLKVQDIADATEIPYGTLSSWFSGRSVLDPMKKAHKEYIASISKAIDVDASVITGSVSESTKAYRVSPGKEVLEILLTTIESQTAPRQQKEDAKAIIREWLKDVS